MCSCARRSSMSSSWGPRSTTTTIAGPRGTAASSSRGSPRRRGDICSSSTSAKARWRRLPPLADESPAHFLQASAFTLVKQQEDGPAELEEFMSVAAHDLRNPIAVVRASAQMAQRQIARGDRDAANGRLQAIVEQTDRLTEMLETFLDAARISDGRLALRPERVVLREAVELAIERARGLVSEYGN